MKTVLSGVPIYKYFAFNAFVGKSFGLFCALVGGASVGRVGPYVHLSCALCYNLLKIDYFNSIYKNVSSRSNMLSIACATGITLALGTPLGGVLFSIESTSSIYITSNIWKSFFSTIISIFIVRFFKKPINLVPISIEEVESKTTPTFLLINFALVGIISGAIGALCSTLVAKGTYIRKRTKYQCLNN